MSSQLTPLDVCRRLIGREDKIAAICGLHEKAPYYWARPSTWRDAGDFPSARYQRMLLAYSDEHGLGLTVEHMVFGAEASAIDAILAARDMQAPPGRAA